MSAEYPGASWVPIPGFGFPTGTHGQNKPRFIIVHATAGGDGTAMGQVNFFRNQSDHGVHFAIGRDGQVVQMVALADAAYGNCCIDEAKHDAFWDVVLREVNNLNLRTISIEHCKRSTDNSDTLTPAQQEASFKLIAWLCERLKIPARPADVNGGITGHYSLNGINRAHCPGPYPWAQLWAYLQPKGMANGVLIQHPTLEMRLDLIYVDTAGNLHHRWTIDGGLAGLAGDSSHTGNESWGNPGKPFAPLSASATWDAQGNYLNVVAATLDGAQWAQVRAFERSVTKPGTWTQISPAHAPALALPSTSLTPSEPLAQKIEVALLDAAHALQSGLA